MVHILPHVRKSEDAGRDLFHLEAQMTYVSDIWPHVAKNSYVMLEQSVRHTKMPCRSME